VAPAVVAPVWLRLGWGDQDGAVTTMFAVSTTAAI
jgi:hypothetical protein